MLSWRQRRVGLFRPRLQTLNHTEATLAMPRPNIGPVMASKMCPHQGDAVVGRHPGWNDQSERGFKVAVLSMLTRAVKEGLLAANPIDKRLDIPPVRARRANAVLGDDDFAHLITH